jgi:dTDP-4-amino-4,6-dideoxygalactose transaminase
MDFVDLRTQQDRIRDALTARITAVLEHRGFIMGPEIGELEKALARFVSRKHGIGCSSGTDALLIGLMALGIGRGDAVFTTPFTFVATAEVIALLGAVPVYVDIDPATFNIDPDKLERAVAAFPGGPASGGTSVPRSGLKPRAIIAVDLFGLPADYDRIASIACAHGLSLIEDAAQSFGGARHDRAACSFGDISCTSFFPSKPLGCYGDGGMCFTDDGALAETMRSIVLHGKGSSKYDHVRVGINGRLDTLQAAIVLAKFTVFPDEIPRRQEAAVVYTQLFREGDAEGRHGITLPGTPNGYRSVWAQYSILARDEGHRDGICAALKKVGIPTAIHYPKPLHLQPAFNGLGYRPGDFPISEDCSRRILSLPMHPYLDPNDQKAVVAAVLSADGGS